MQRLFAFLLAPARLKPLFWLLLAFTLTMALLPKPPHTPLDRYGDKFEHMVAFFVLTVVASVAWRNARRVSLALWLAGFGAAIEVLQLIPVLHRDSDYRDWIADVLAVLIGLAVARLAEPVIDWLTGETRAG